MPTNLALLTVVKFPEPGKVKTRLAAEIGDELAAEVYCHFIAQTFARVKSLTEATPFVAFTPEEKATEFQRMFPGGQRWFAQINSSNFGVRLRHAVQAVLQQDYQRVITIGSDSPTLPPAYLKEAAEALASHDLVLGPAEDGGYYLIGLKSAPAELFEGIAWSTEKVLQQTLAAAQRLGLRVHLLPEWYDVDDLPALHRYCLTSDVPHDLAARLKPFLLRELVDYHKMIA
ncbi:TIGR04282 family arsenosugar biosynthesis glycosyltransferase [candidate division KSB1 bacterium]|nr:TIGR04282 family arsenosugar biosynthesis glycosyltransferase [candidate division KSB1 bacterium]